MRISLFKHVPFQEKSPVDKEKLVEKLLKQKQPDKERLQEIILSVYKECRNPRRSREGDPSSRALLALARKHPIAVGQAVTERLMLMGITTHTPHVLLQLAFNLPPGLAIRADICLRLDDSFRNGKSSVITEKEFLAVHANSSSRALENIIIVERRETEDAPLVGPALKILLERLLDPEQRAEAAQVLHRLFNNAELTGKASGVVTAQKSSCSDRNFLRTLYCRTHDFLNDYNLPLLGVPHHAPLALTALIAQSLPPNVEIGKGLQRHLGEHNPYLRRELMPEGEPSVEVPVSKRSPSRQEKELDDYEPSMQEGNPFSPDEIRLRQRLGNQLPKHPVPRKQEFKPRLDREVKKSRNQPNWRQNSQPVYKQYRENSGLRKAKESLPGRNRIEVGKKSPQYQVQNSNFRYDIRQAHQMSVNKLSVRSDLSPVEWQGVFLNQAYQQYLMQLSMQQYLVSMNYGHMNVGEYFVYPQQQFHRGPRMVPVLG